MKPKSNVFEGAEIDSFISRHGGKPTDNETLQRYMNSPERKGFVEYYEFSDGSLLSIENFPTGKCATLYDDKNAYVKNLLKLEEWRTSTPLHRYQEQIRNLPEHARPLINELFTKLKLDKNIPLKEMDLKKLDHAIKKYGTEKSYEDLFLQLILFGGEYLKEKLGGHWVIEKSNKNEDVPVFVDDKNKKHYLDFWIEKSFKKDNKISMEIIIGAELIGPLSAYPNTSLKNPNDE